METINNVASAASKAIWGEQKQTEEPVSGQQGDTSKGEPFDKGNVEEPKSTTDATTSGTTSHSKESAPEFVKSTGTAAESDKVPDNKQTELKAKDTPHDTTKGQNDVRDPEDPQTNPKNVPSDVDNTGDGPNEGQKLDGPGPKPLIEVAKEHGGDAGNKEKSTDALAGEDKNDKKEEEKDPNDPSAPSSGEGTGEQYVKSSGLKADGGDFDATKPGAGREADRLLEEKGIHHETGPPKLPTDDKADSSEKEKKSLGTKIKEKLHIHH